MNSTRKEKIGRKNITKTFFPQCHQQPPTHRWVNFCLSLHPSIAIIFTSIRKKLLFSLVSLFKVIFVKEKSCELSLKCLENRPFYAQILELFWVIILRQVIEQERLKANWKLCQKIYCLALKVLCQFCSRFRSFNDTLYSHV